MVLKDKILSQILSFLSSEKLSISNVCFFMQQIRLLLEINYNKDEYIISKHYCNWLLHKNLARSNSPEIIDEISNLFQTFKTNNELVKNISKTLSLKKLVEELNEILWLNIQDKKALANIIGNQDYWIYFIRIILSQISYRPLLLKKTNIDIGNYGFSIYGIQIVNGKNNQLYIELLSKELENKKKKIRSEIILYKEN